MDTKPKPGEIVLGTITLFQRPDGTVLVRHQNLKAPVEIPHLSLEAWLKKHIRDAVS